MPSFLALATATKVIILAPLTVTSKCVWLALHVHSEKQQRSWVTLTDGPYTCLICFSQNRSPFCYPIQPPLSSLQLEKQSLLPQGCSSQSASHWTDTYQPAAKRQQDFASPEISALRTSEPFCQSIGCSVRRTLKQTSQIQGASGLQRVLRDCPQFQHSSSTFS